MAQRVNGALDALSEAMPKYPFIWGLTTRWFKGDRVWVVPLTADLLKTFCFTSVPVSPYSWEILQRFPKKKGEETLNDLGRFGRRRVNGIPLAPVLRRYTNVHVLIKFEAWVSNHRQVTLYLVPQGPHGSKLRELCDEALKDRAALRRAVQRFQGAETSRSIEIFRRLAKRKNSNIDLEASIRKVVNEGDVSVRKILKAARLA